MPLPSILRLLSRRPGGRRFEPQQQIQAYNAVPQPVLADLAEFCGAADPAPTDGDAFKQGRAAGRRDVWLRIAAHRAVRDDEIFALLRGDQIAHPKERRDG